MPQHGSGLRAWNGSDPAPHFAVHRNNVVGSLVDALAEIFPVVQALVGVEFFRGLGRLHSYRHAPRSPILAHYGSDFPAFIEQFAPARLLPYLPDVARLELARVRAYHAADIVPVTADAVRLALQSGGRIGDLRLVCHPAVTPINSRHAVMSLWERQRGAREGSAPDAGPAEAAIVMRHGFEVLVLRTKPGVNALVAASARGLCFGEAAAAAGAADPGFDLTSTLAILLSRGALISLDLDGSGPAQSG